LGQEEFLSTGGDVLKFSQETHKDIYKHMKEKPMYCEFLIPHRVIYRQVNEEVLDVFVNPPMQKKKRIP